MLNLGVDVGFASVHFFIMSPPSGKLRRWDMNRDFTVVSIEKKVKVGAMVLSDIARLWLEPELVLKLDVRYNTSIADRTWTLRFLTFD